MAAVSEAVMGLVCVAVAAAVVQLLSGGRLALLCALAVTVTAVSSVRGLDLSGLYTDWESCTRSAEAAVKEAEAMAEESILSVIKESTEAYILDKAGAMGLELEVNVMVDADTRLPVAVSISGFASEESAEVLKAYIRENLGIEGSAVIWPDN